MAGTVARCRRSPAGMGHICNGGQMESVGLSVLGSRRGRHVQCLGAAMTAAGQRILTPEAAWRPVVCAPPPSSPPHRAGFGCERVLSSAGEDAQNTGMYLLAVHGMASWCSWLSHVSNTHKVPRSSLGEVTVISFF